jgi:hypothetical protein
MQRLSRDQRTYVLANATRFREAAAACGFRAPNAILTRPSPKSKQRICVYFENGKARIVGRTVARTAPPLVVD